MGAVKRGALVELGPWLHLLVGLLLQFSPVGVGVGGRGSFGVLGAAVARGDVDHHVHAVAHLRSQPQRDAPAVVVLQVLLLNILVRLSQQLRRVRVRWCVCGPLT